MRPSPLGQPVPKEYAPSFLLPTPVKLTGKHVQKTQSGDLCAFYSNPITSAIATPTW